MAYVTQEQVVVRLGSQKAAELTTDSGSSPSIELIEDVIDEVEGEIATAVSKRTAVEITLADYTDTFYWLRGIAMALVIASLASRRPPVPEDWQRAATAAKEALGKLAEGQIDLPDTSLQGDRATSSSSRPVMGREAWNVGGESE